MNKLPPPPEEGLGSSGDLKVRATAAGGLMTAKLSPAAWSVQIVVAAALRSEAAAFSPSLRGPSASSTDEGVIVSNGDGYVVDRSNLAKTSQEDSAGSGWSVEAPASLSSVPSPMELFLRGGFCGTHVSQHDGVADFLKEIGGIINQRSMSQGDTQLRPRT